MRNGRCGEQECLLKPPQLLEYWSSYYSRISETIAVFVSHIHTVTLPHTCFFHRHKEIRTSANNHIFEHSDLTQKVMCMFIKQSCKFGPTRS